MTEIDLTPTETIFRLVLAIIIGGVVGFERERKSRPAGMKTHIMVCIGAAIIALIQEELTWNAVQFTKDNPKLLGVITSDEARLTAQVVSGVGFLGAGTIVMNKRSVTGLTTAASIWTVAGLGIAVGMGMYMITFCGFIGIMLALCALSYLVPMRKIKRLYMELEHGEKTKLFIQGILKGSGIIIENTNFTIEREDQRASRKYGVTFVIAIPNHVDENDILLKLSENSDILKLKLIG